MEEGKDGAGLAHLCLWPLLILAVPAEHGGGGGRGSAVWKALVSWAWHGCGRRGGAVLTAPRKSHRSRHHVSPSFWQPQPAWPSSAAKKAKQAPGLVLPQKLLDAVGSCLLGLCHVKPGQGLGWELIWGADPLDLVVMAQFVA